MSTSAPRPEAELKESATEMSSAIARLLDFETAVDAATLTDVQLSPDGCQVVYVTSRASTQEDTPPVGTLWLVSADGGPSRRLTASEAGDGLPALAPDGKRIAFLSDRKTRGVAQLYLLDPGRGGEAVRLTDQDGGVVDLQWSPDGELIAFTAVDGVSDEEKKRKEDHDEQVMDRGAKATGLWVLSVPDDAGTLADGELPDQRRLSAEGAHIGAHSFSWAPDGATLVATTAKSPKVNDVVSPELVIFDRKGEVRSVAHIEWADMPGCQPRFSPDGSMIAFNGAEEAFFPAMFSLQVVPVAGGGPRVLVPGHNGAFFAFTWLPDGKRLLATVHEGQQGRLVIVDPELARVTDAISPFERPGTLAPLLSVSADGQRAAIVRATDTAGGEVFVADLDEKGQQLTDLNPWARDFAFGEVREVSWTSFDGLEIQGLLVLPVGYEEGRRYPTLVEIHGGPAGFWGHGLFFGYTSAVWGQYLAQRGYAVLLPNPRGSAGRGTAFQGGIIGCYGEPDGRDILSGVDKVIALGIADPDRLVVGGASGGGFLTNWIVTHTDRFKAAVSVCGISNWVSFQGTTDIRVAFDRYFGPVNQDPEKHWHYSPVRYIKNAKTPTLIIFGAHDERVPPSQGQEMYEGLKACGVDTKLVLYPREGHGIVERQHQIDYLKRVVEWFDGHLGSNHAAL